MLRVSLNAPRADPQSQSLPMLRRSQHDNYSSSSVGARPLGARSEARRLGADTESWSSSVSTSAGAYHCCKCVAF